MKTGNKNQAVMLSVVAVGAIAFLVIELMPAKMRPSLAQILPTAGKTEPSIVVTNDLPLTLVGDPFSHPKLALKDRSSNARIR